MPQQVSPPARPRARAATGGRIAGASDGQAVEVGPQRLEGVAFTGDLGGGPQTEAAEDRRRAPALNRMLQQEGGDPDR